MEEKFKIWARLSNTFEEFNKKFCIWLVFQEVDPDNCYSDDELRRKYNMYHNN